ncbi:hypothetical protein EB796_020834 [Bugula neritina]|uniref:Doublecortin domain-containing protein n=1 Tax=Bugula neritina TaxID=10212 RepID=A0A7J7J5C4_BUGNE|nr:hypothetical protein EB796_020834 [Bugula neritina]
MVYLNGQHTNCVEVISDLKSMDDFLGSVTGKLALRSHARIIYDWSGKEIKDFESIPVMDPCLQEAGTPVLGPVWASCGGGFSPSGACKFLESIITHLRKSLKDSKYNKTQMMHAKNGETVELVALSSLSMAELDTNISELSQDISNMSATLKKMKNIHSEISEDAKKEEDEGYSYVLQHIKEVDASDNAVGGSGLKLKVFRNGDYGRPAIVYFNTRQASRGIKDSKLIFERLLDQCASRVTSASSQSTKFARRLFDVNGDEIKDIYSLKSEQEIFVSTGEPFKMPYVLCLEAFFEQVKGVDMQYPHESPPRQTAVFDQSVTYLETQKTEWEGSIGFPADYHWFTCSETTKAEIREEILESKELDINSHWLVHKEKRDMVLYPSLIVSDRKKKGANDLWPAEAQLWVLNKGGYIACRGMPHMVMAVLDTRVDCETKGKSKIRVTGYAVGLQKRQEGNPAQQWRFTNDGSVYSMSQPELILTFLGAKYSRIEEEMVVNEVEGVPNGFVPHLAVCEKITGKEASLQR